MGVIRSREFLLCTQKGLWHIHKDNNCMVTYQRYNNDGTIDLPLRISGHVVADFSVDIDDKGTPHIFFFTMKGELFYGYMNKDIWDIQLLSTFDPLKYTIFCPDLIINSNNIHLFFIIKDYQNNTHNILHHYWNNAQWKINKVTELNPIVKNQVKLNAKIDSEKNLHLIYNTGKIQGYYQLHYIKHNHRLNLWGSPIEVTNRLNNYLDWDLAIDNNNNANIAWIAKTDVHNICLCILYNSMDMQTFNGIVESRSMPCSHVSLFQVNNSLNLLWQENKNLWIKESKDGGKTWHELYRLSLGDKDVNYFNLINPSFIDTNNVYYDKSLRVFGSLQEKLYIYRLCDFIPLFNGQSQQEDNSHAENGGKTDADKTEPLIKSSPTDNPADNNYQNQTKTWGDNDSLTDIGNYTTQELLQYIKHRIDSLNNKHLDISEKLLKISEDMQKVDAKIKTWQHIIDRLEEEISILKEKTLLKKIIKLLKSQ